MGCILTEYPDYSNFVYTPNSGIDGCLGSAQYSLPNITYIDCFVTAACLFVLTVTKLRISPLQCLAP